MLNKIFCSKAASAAFITAEALLCVLIQTVGGRVNDVLSVLSVALAFIFVLTGTVHTPRVDLFILTAAFFFNTLADVFLILVTPAMPISAMLCFSVVAALYFLLILFSTESKESVRIHIFVRLALLTVMLFVTLGVLGEAVDFLAVISVLYFTNLILNIIFSALLGPGRILLTVGLVFFAVCDVFVGFSMMGEYLSISEGTFAYFLAHPGFNAAWLFYVPAQLFLALSARFCPPAKNSLKIFACGF